MVGQYTRFFFYSHPAQLLIRREGSSWNHLDGVLLQSAGTNIHRPLKRGINILPITRYLCWPPGPHGRGGATCVDKGSWWPIPDSVPFLWSFALFFLHVQSEGEDPPPQGHTHINHTGSVPLHNSWSVRDKYNETKEKWGRATKDGRRQQHSRSSVTVTTKSSWTQLVENPKIYLDFFFFFKSISGEKLYSRSAHVTASFLSLQSGVFYSNFPQFVCRI